MTLPGPLLTADDHGEYPMLRCPVPGCEFTYVKVTAPSFSKDDGDYTGILGFRGAEVSIPMECENGHAWRIVLAFHKGHTFIGAAPALDAAPQMPS